MAILEDLAIIPQSKMLAKASESCACFKDVCILLKVWLAQKNIRFGVDNLDSHCIQIIVAYLIQSRRIGQQTAVLGAFQTVLGFLADTKFDSTELNFVGENNSTKGIWPATLYHPVGKDINDVSFNSLWRVSSSGMMCYALVSCLSVVSRRIDIHRTPSLSFGKNLLKKKHHHHHLQLFKISKTSLK